MASAKLQFIIKEYRLLWQSLRHYEAHLEKLSATCEDEDQRVDYEEDLQNIEGMKRAIAQAAKAEYDIELG
jgi:hypothetical protein